MANNACIRGIVIVGSHALNFHKNTRNPADLDGIGVYDDIMYVLHGHSKMFSAILPSKDGNKMIGHTKPPNCPWEFEIAWSGSTGEKFMNLVEDDVQTTRSDVWKLIPSLNALYALKMSHRYLKNSPNFLKTMKDIHLLRNLGATISDRYKEWYKERERETYNYSHPKLNQSKMDFFSDDGIKYVFDHDSIHRAVAIHDVPAYTLFQKDGEQVAVDRNKWDSLPLNIQLASVVEESYVLALERSLIPNPGILTPKKAFNTALMKVCTSITSGWWREFAWENYFNVQKMYNPNYFDIFNKAVDSGVVKRL